MPPKALNPKTTMSHATGPPKMRSSCKACADSKIGCTKERPTCSRCERRDVPCVYVATKRAGRPAKNKRPQSPPMQTDIADNSAPSVPSSASPSSQSSCTGWPKDMSNTPSIFAGPSSMPHQTMDWCFSEFTDLLEGVPGSTAEKDDFVSSLPPLTQPFSQLLNVSSPPNLLENNLAINFDSFLFPSPMGSKDNYFQHFDKTVESTQNGCTNNLTGGDFNNDTPVPSGSRRTAETPAELIDWFAVPDASNSGGFPPASEVSTSKDYPVSSPLTSHRRGSARGCLARCLYLLDQLTPQWAAATCTQDGEKSSTPTSMSFESVIGQNQAAIDTVDEILKCSCCHNSVLLFALALVMFKMLGWYAACINATPHAPRAQDSDDSGSITPASSLGRRPSIVCGPSQTTLLEYETDTEYEDRIVCQMVLSRLYHVRHTLNVLTQRLTARQEQQGSSTSSTEHFLTAADHLLLDGPAFDSSNSSNLGQSLANNLRSHLHQLCENIVGILSAT